MKSSPLRMLSLAILFLISTAAQPITSSSVSKPQTWEQKMVAKAIQDTKYRLQSPPKAVTKTAVKKPVVKAPVVPSGRFSPLGGKKLVTYYGGSAQRPITVNDGFNQGLPPWEMDWRGITHIVHSLNADNVVSTYPYYTQVGGGADSILIEFGDQTPYVHYLDSLVAIGHRNGAKVLTCIAMVGGGDGFAYICQDVARIDVFCSVVLIPYMLRQGYDGVELDVEGTSNPTQAQMLLFLQRLRFFMNTMMPQGSISIAADVFQSDFYTASIVDPLVDYYDPQFYGGQWWNGAISSNAIFPLSPIYRGQNPDPANFASLAEGRDYDGFAAVTSWINAGHDPAKIVVGVQTEAYLYTTVDTLFAPVNASTFPDMWWYTKWRNAWDARDMVNHGGVYVWDNVRKASWIYGVSTVEGGTWFPVHVGDKFIVTDLSFQAVDSICAYVIRTNLGGMMAYDIPHDLKSSMPFGQRTPLLKRMAIGLNTTTPPLPLPTGTFTVNPSALPLGGGSVTLSWASPDAQTASIDNGIGAVPVNGSRVVPVTTTTTFTIQFINQNGFTRLLGTVTVAVPLPSTFALGDTNLYPMTDSQNANLLCVTKATSTRVGTTQVINFYVATAAGNLRLGIYRDNNGTPVGGALVGTTNSFVPVAGWNRVTVTTPTSLPVGTYWLAFLPNNNGLVFRIQRSSGTHGWTNFTFGPLPATFPSGFNTSVGTWCIYATLNAGPPPPPPVVVNYDSVTVGNNSAQFGVRTLNRDTLVVVQYLVNIRRVTTDSATVVVTPKPFKFKVPQGQTNMSFVIPDTIRIQK